MSLFGPVTNADCLGWQCVAADLLAELLAKALRQDLPAVRWTVTPAGGGLVGYCDSRAAWSSWQAQLQLPDVSPEITHATMTRLRASGRVRTRHGRTVPVTLLGDADHLREPLLAGDPQDAA